MVSRIMAPQDVYTLNIGACEYVTFPGKGTLPGLSQELEGKG